MQWKNNVYALYNTWTKEPRISCVEAMKKTTAREKFELIHLGCDMRITIVAYTKRITASISANTLIWISFIFSIFIACDLFKIREKSLQWQRITSVLHSSLLPHYHFVSLFFVFFIWSFFVLLISVRRSMLLSVRNSVSLANCFSTNCHFRKENRSLFHRII